MGDQRLRPVERLRCPRAYQRVFEQGEKLVGSLFVLYVLPTSESYSRLGIAVSKRIGNAVVRNRIKRYLREMFRRHKAFLLKKSDSKKRRPSSTIYGHVLILRSKQQQLEPVLIVSGFLNIFH